VKGCLLFVAIFLLGIGVMIGGFVYDFMYTGVPFQDAGPVMHRKDEVQSERARLLQVGGLAMSFCAIFGAAGLQFYRRLQLPDEDDDSPPSASGRK
jgi:hypothetical protein